MLASALALGLLTLSADFPSGCRTIAEQILARPSEKSADTLEIYRSYDSVVVPFDELNASTPLVIEGVVTPVRTYLSEDACEIRTDYRVVASWTHRGSLPAATKPGIPANQVIVTTIGGRMQVDGVPVVYEVMQLRPFRTGQNLLLMLAPSPESGAYGPGLSGAFEVVNGQVRHLLDSGGGHAYPPLDRAAFLLKLHSK